jgi:hypothetical protein
MHKDVIIQSLIGPIIIGLFTFYGNLINKRAYNCIEPLPEMATFKIHKIFFLLCFILGSFSSWTIVKGFYDGLGGILFFGTLGIFFLLLSLVALYASVRAYAEINKYELIYYDGFKRKRIPLSSITQVLVLSLQIQIVTESGTRLIIPSVFSKSWNLIAMLRAASLNNLQNSHINVLVKQQ